MFAAVAIVGLALVVSRTCSSPAPSQNVTDSRVAKKAPVSNVTPERIEQLRAQTEQQIQQLRGAAEEERFRLLNDQSAGRVPLTREEALDAIKKEGQHNPRSTPVSDPQEVQAREAARDRVQQERDARIAQEKKELSASNVYRQTEEPAQFRMVGDQQPNGRHAFSEIGGTPGPVSPPEDVAPESSESQPAFKRNPLDFDPSKVTTYWLPESSIIQAVLITQLNGEKPGPVMAQVTQDVFLPGSRKVMIPAGAVVMGEAKAVSAEHQKRLAVFFHRALVRTEGLPYGIPLDEPGLSQSGESGLHDKVDNHYLSIFGASLAVGAIGGLAQIGNSGDYLDPSSQVRQGISQRMAQTSEQVMNHFLNQLPTVIIRAGQRLVILLTGDLAVPAYETMTDLAAATGPMVPVPVTDADVKRRRIQEPR